MNASPETGSVLTPGPWRVYGDTVDAHDHAPICYAEGADNWSANARLIAAAPDLLGALKEIVEELGDHDNFGKMESGGCGGCLALKRAREVIAKATEPVEGEARS